MSAPDTNIERQTEKHKPALFGIRAAMIFGALMLVGVGIVSVSGGGDTTVGEVYDGDVETKESTVGFDTYAPGTNQSN